MRPQVIATSVVRGIDPLTCVVCSHPIYRGAVYHVWDDKRPSHEHCLIR